MHCEFCDISLYDLASARKHMLSIAHVRKKRQHDLSTSKLADKLKQATIHPKDFSELTKLINIYSRKDVNALDDNEFFKVNTKTQSKIVRELIKILHEDMNNYHFNRLLPDLRLALIQALEKQKRSTR